MCSINKYIAKLISVEHNGTNSDSTWSWRKERIGICGILCVIKDSMCVNLGGQYAILYNEQGEHLRTGYGTAKHVDKNLVFTTKNSIYTFKLKNKI